MSFVAQKFDTEIKYFGEDCQSFGSFKLIFHLRKSKQPISNLLSNIKVGRRLN